MPALAAYRGLLSATGASFFLLSFLARLPSAMGALGTLTLVAATTGSFAAAGVAAGALGLGTAFGGPVVGLLSDRYGQRPVGIVTALVDTVAYIALLVTALIPAPTVAIAAVAALAGFANPQVGPLIRARWAALLVRQGRGHLVPVAMSYEGSADETAYVTGPALVGILALTGQPAIPLAGTALLLLIFGVLFALHPTAPPRVGTAERSSRGGLPVELLGVIAAMGCVGVIFGATQTAVTALVASAGYPGSGGLVYGLTGVGGIIAGLLTAVLPARFRLIDRAVIFAVVLLAATAGLPVVHSLGIAIVVLFLVGAAVAPYLITLYGLTGQMTPSGRAGTALTVVTSGVLAGIAAGAALAGMLTDAYGYSAAFLLPLLASVGALAVAVGLRQRLSRLVGGCSRSIQQFR